MVCVVLLESIVGGCLLCGGVRRGGRGSGGEGRGRVRVWVGHGVWKGDVREIDSAGWESDLLEGVIEGDGRRVEGLHVLVLVLVRR